LTELGADQIEITGQDKSDQAVDENISNLEGEVVYYVTRAGQRRPAIVTEAFWEQGEKDTLLRKPRPGEPPMPSVTLFVLLPTSTMHTEPNAPVPYSSKGDRHSWHFKTGRYSVPKTNPDGAIF
jgi:hypothetical protein